jgi:hypothetical protein
MRQKQFSTTISGFKVLLVQNCKLKFDEVLSVNFDQNGFIKSTPGQLHQENLLLEVPL